MYAAFMYKLILGAHAHAAVRVDLLHAGVFYARLAWAATYIDFAFGLGSSSTDAIKCSLLLLDRRRP